MRIVVTGATSMIGVALIEKSIEHGDEILAIVREGTSRLSRLPKSDLIKLAYADLDTLETVTGDGNSYDVFYHFAWAHTNKQERDDAILQEKNIKYTLDAVELAHRLGCHRFVGAGSQAEYGRVDAVIDEETKCSPLIAYGMAKLSANYLSRKLCDKYEMEHLWGRIFSVYGINDNKDTMIDYALNTLAKNEVATFSSGEQMWNYLYEADAGEIFYRLGKVAHLSGVYCVANEKSRQLKCYINEMASLLGKDNLIKFNMNSTPLGLQVNLDNLINTIGEINFTSFEDGMQKIINNR
ncbi:Nucleoside-diphosphate-sugar epimerase [Pseudobutyrivibrio sp. JW11]|uniref:NAD-dependent epimerase/dehydratase family protein n=1 Tax=Pseudobutyrivibrio sp. JW11 TaxID=1855302 RepID=UPI0008E9F769|nr:NAD-dependent epimerase/dehydratase family protein [Pseudobutyrivibrio sp. JW11]SFO34460.1 Nucleoside-diphosphate-sugar epimerase [Pseudobutyrivibrio sp. JW11]